MEFRVHGNSVGDGVLTFDTNPPDAAGDVLEPLVGPGRAVAHVTFKVVECTYTLIVKSEWTIQTGWKYAVSSRLVAEVVPDQDGKFSAFPVVENTHTQRIRLPGPCTKKPEIEKTRANVDGRISDEGQFDFKVTYDPVHEATTTASCSSPVGSTGEKQAQGTGTAQIYNPEPVNIGTFVGGPGSSVSDTFPHALHSDVGDAVGRGVFTILTHVVSP
jgi:hypothetical protein